MKTFVISIAALAIAFSACSNNSSQTKQAANENKDTGVTKAQVPDTSGQQGTQVNEALNAYIQIKNALASDNGQEAAAGGNAFVTAIGKVDKSAMSAEQKQTFQEIADDAKEMAEHIGKSADKIEHQREHFDMLSQDMYDLVKSFGGGRPLYKDYCPMYNNNKGASWISETKVIKNPYLGKKMPECGEVKEEIKK